MIVFKNRDFLAYMHDIAEFDQGIAELNNQWDNIKLLCEINCPIQAMNVLPSVVNIQNGFYSLQQELIETLISEKLKMIEEKSISKTQAQIDLLIRNLYERTADVGFLAMDDDIREFVQDDSRDDIKLEKIKKRLREYVAKYSVYEEIIILDQNNQVIANLDDKSSILGETINDPIITETLESREGFLETFRPSGLRPEKSCGHIFTSRITDVNGARTIGTICLCFRFDNEMEGIFKHLTRDEDGSVITIIDKNNRVIASSDNSHIPNGTKVEIGESGVAGIVYYHGISYLAKTIETNGYQGYYGLGWRGHIMIPLDAACREQNAISDLDQETMEGLTGMADSFSTDLTGIIDKTKVINNSLRRIIYNGQIIARDESLQEEYTRLKPILRAIGRIGSRTTSLVRSSVVNLFTSAVSSNLIDSGFVASLCVEIMDRNLYERANDCRWWALNSTFRRLLSKSQFDEGDRQRITDILKEINSLYTVYENLFIFDTEGVIMAVSNPKHSEEIGKILSEPYIKNILYNAQPESYFVSPFERTALYGDRPTYIYGASITDIEQPGRVVGGIGIVFDSEDQFNRILKENVDREKSFAVITDRQKNIIASTNPKYEIGAQFPLENGWFVLENGSSESKITFLDEHYVAIGCSCSSGYREYKRSDGYQNDVLAFVAFELAEGSSARANTVAEIEIEQTDIKFVMNEKNVKLATFGINSQVFGLDESIVIEALDTSQIISMPGISGAIKGAVEYEGRYVSVVNPDALFENDERMDQMSSLLILQLSPTERVALLVDELFNVLEINAEKIRKIGISSSIAGVFSVEDGTNRNILVIDHQVLLEKLIDQELMADFMENLPQIQELAQIEI